MRLSSIGIGLYTMLSCSHSLFGGRASFDVLVIDSETMKPLPNVKVEGSFLNYSRGWGIAAKDNDVDAWTDRHGLVRLSGNTEKGIGGYRIYGTPNYYNAEWKEIRFQEQSLLRLGAWQPSGIVSTARLDRIITPRPLFVKHMNAMFCRKEQWHYFMYADYADVAKFAKTNEIPVVSNKVLSCDLVNGQFKIVEGASDNADVLFTFNERTDGWRESRGGGGVSLYRNYRRECSIAFPGNGNGLFEMHPSDCAGIKIRTAPLRGYVRREQRLVSSGTGRKTDFDKSRCYTFRIRTMYDDRGEIKSALYGKIYGDFDVETLCGVSFLYYLNPTPNDRNLEWDMKMNLCPNPGDIGNPQP